MKLRVKFSERCGTGSWSTPEVIRTGSGSDQIIEFGRPNVVLNREEHLVHVLFVELDAYSTSDDLQSVTKDGDVWWYWKGYTPC